MVLEVTDAVHTQTHSLKWSFQPLRLVATLNYFTWSTTSISSARALRRSDCCCFATGEQARRVGLCFPGRDITTHELKQYKSHCIFSKSYAHDHCPKLARALTTQRARLFLDRAECRPDLNRHHLCNADKTVLSRRQTDPKSLSERRRDDARMSCSCFVYTTSQNCSSSLGKGGGGRCFLNFGAT